MKDYSVLHLSITPLAERDTILALLAMEGYDSFEETAQGLKAYIPTRDFRKQSLEALAPVHSGEVDLQWEREDLESINWNERWERHYAPVELGKDLRIRAPFHDPDPSFQREIEIEPKMSFGTGHHQTTRLMAQMMGELSWDNRLVLDMGTGTGVLAIYAQMLGASSVDALDNFDWAVTNTEENAQRNGCRGIRAELGDASALPGRSYEVILANINRNVLLQDMRQYRDCLQAGGDLLLSGFLASDEKLIEEEALRWGLRKVKTLHEEEWRCAYYRLPNSNFGSAI